MVDLFRNQHWDLVSKRGLYYIISAIILVIGFIALFTPGKGLNLGIDFKGGGLVTYRVEGRIPAGQDSKVIGAIRAALKSKDIDSEVQVSPGALDGSGDQIIIRTLLTEGKDVNHDEVLASQIKESITPAVSDALRTVNKPAPVLDSQEVVTGTVSSELVSNAVIALVIGSLLIMGWIGIRYNIGGAGFRYSAGGIIALLHDLAILVGLFAIFRNYLQVNSPFIAALLTVLGYSIHDTIIIYDRIRENLRLRKGRTFAETVNISLLETLARSVNTVLTVLFTLLALFFFGGPTLRDFVAAMLIGIVIGAYSSIFIASQLLVSWSKGKDRIILPAGETLTAVAAPAPQLVTAGAATTNVAAPVAAPRAAVSPDAVQRARQTGKTSKRRK